MTSFRVIGPLPFSLGEQPLAPGQSVHTFWTTEPPLGAGTVHLTVHPDLNELVPGPAGGITLAVTNLSVQWEGAVGPAQTPTTKRTIHADVVNVGQNPAKNAAMYISYLEL